ncbi:MAG: hypothetical protein E7233_09935 [Lachnospiraceae bacterium]|nr:hypothetical protein [Lachnospiraceae bacterium]
MFQNGLAWVVRNCGTLFYDIRDWDKEVSSLTTELTEEEKKSKFAKYYNRQLKMPSVENLKAAQFDNPLPKDRLFKPEEFVKHMDSEEIDNIKSGYGLFDDGIGFSIARIRLDGLTDEKRQYFTDNFIPEADLFYKCWYPGMHMRHYIAGAVEDVGLGMELINFLVPIGPEGWAGSPDYEYKDPLLIAVIGGGGVSWPLYDRFNHPRYCLQGNWFRYLPDKSGIEIFITFWHGMGWENGKPVRKIPDDEKISIDRVRSQFNHSIWEFTQLSALINSFWEDNH